MVQFSVIMANTASNVHAKKPKYPFTPRQYFSECLHAGISKLHPSTTAASTTRIPATINHSPTEKGNNPVILP